MKPLTYEEILQVFKHNQYLAWHPEYEFQAWKDGIPPLEIVSCSFQSSQDGIDYFFIGYKCSRPNCSACAVKNETTELGSHHILITHDGFGRFKRIEQIEKKKKTEIEEYDEPVFINYGEEVELNDWSLVFNPKTMALPTDKYIRVLDNKTKLISSNLVSCDLKNRIAITNSGNIIKLNIPNAGWIRWLKSKRCESILKELGII